MEIGWTPVLLLATLALDATAVGQFGFSRPLVAGTLAGALAGEVHTGFFLGALVELIWANDLPVGSHLPPDLTVLAGAAGFTAAKWTKEGLSEPAGVVFFLLVVLPVAVFSSRAEVVLRHWHSRWVLWVEKEIQKGRMWKFEVLLPAALFVQWLKAALFSFLALWVAHGLGRFWSWLPEEILQGLEYAYWFLWVLGCSVLFELIWNRKNAFFFFFCMLASCALLLFADAPPLIIALAGLVGVFGYGLFQRLPIRSGR